MKNLTMLKALKGFESELPKLLTSIDEWNSLYVDYSLPIVERLWREWMGFRIFLHKIHPCDFSTSLYHTHNWPSGMKVVSGKYEMGIGYGPGSTPPPIASTLILPAGSYYEMVDKDAWHYVRPLDDFAYSIMITGTPWGSGSPKSGTPLRELSQHEKEELFMFFKKMYQ